jgi:phospholipase C
MRVSLLTSVLALGATVAALPKDSNSKDKKDDFKDKIKNVVVLVLENRSFDTFAGGLTYNEEIDGLVHRKYCNPVNVTDPTNHDQICAADTALNVAPYDPNHSMTGGNLQVYGTIHPKNTSPALMNGFVTEQTIAHKSQPLNITAEVINYYSPSHIPVFNAMAENFVLFDRWFAAVPGPTNPNRAYLTSGTSAGHGKNDASFGIHALTQRSIFQQLTEKNITWANYYNSSFAPDAMFYDWTVQSGNNVNVKKLNNYFWDDAKNGNLPQFTYINPECCSYDSFHPPSSMFDGENFIKRIYEALRNGPQWKDTLFIMTFDEHGGFADHVAPPSNVPAGDSLYYTEVATDGVYNTFDFTTLGVRVPTVIMSDWVAKGAIETHGRNNGKVYTHTSILAFLAKLWNLDNLTPRTAWSATFEDLILDKRRNDTPAKLPNAVNY